MNPRYIVHLFVEMDFSEQYCITGEYYVKQSMSTILYMFMVDLSRPLQNNVP